MKITQSILEKIIEEELNLFISEIQKGDIGYVKKYDSIGTVYGESDSGDLLKVKIGKTGEVVEISSDDIEIFPDDEPVDEEPLSEKNVPTQPSKWNYYKNQAKKKFDVYPSAYANAWASKKYKAAGGKWRTEESVQSGQRSIEADYYKIQNKLKSIENMQKKLMKPYLDARTRGDITKAKELYTRLQKLKNVHLQAKEKFDAIEIEYLKNIE